MQNFTMQFEFVDTDESSLAKTAYNDSGCVITMNERSFLKLTIPEQCNVIQHEASHAFVSMIYRIIEGRVYNTAPDMIINDALTKDYREL